MTNRQTDTTNRQTSMPNQHKRVYIAGPMTGHDNYNREAFIEAARQIAASTCLIPVHTAWMADGLAYEDYMDLSIDLLEDCDLITGLTGWRESPGAQLEVQYAKGNSIPYVEFKDLFHEYPKE